MKQIITSHENQIRQQVFPTPATRPLSPQGLTAEEQKEWDEALTPDEFMEEMKVLLKKIFDERDRRVQ
jgi:hypothetical protein